MSINLARLAIQGVKLPSGHTLLGFIEHFPGDKGGASYAVLKSQSGVCLAWNGRSLKSLPNNWRKKSGAFEPAGGVGSVVVNTTQPADLLAAIDAEAQAAGQSRSVWIGEACAAALPESVRESLLPRPGAHRPARK